MFITFTWLSNRFTSIDHELTRQAASESNKAAEPDVFQPECGTTVHTLGSSFMIFLPLTRKLFSITFGTLAAINLPLDACSPEREEEHVHARSHAAQSRDYFQA